MIEIYTDGAASGNPGPGGYGVILRSGKHYKELSAGFRMTTNNRMELLAVIVALQALKTPGQQVTIYSDSKYVIDAIEKKWIDKTEKSRTQIRISLLLYGSMSIIGFFGLAIYGGSRS